VLDSHEYKQVIVLAPSHAQVLHGCALLSAHTYQTPLGVIKLDVPAAQELIHNPLFIYDDSAFAREHAIEIQLPLVQYYLKKVVVLPIIVGDLTIDEIEQIARVLEPLLSKNTLLVISSDFTHYGARYHNTIFVNNLLARIKKLDSRSLDSLAQFNARDFLATMQEPGQSVCGRLPIALACAILKQKTDIHAHVVAYDTSTTSETECRSGCVSYVGMTFTTAQSLSFNQLDKRELFTSAQTTLNKLFDTKISADLLQPLHTPTLAKHMGAFVTLKKRLNGELRGCIGNIIAQRSLYESIPMLTKDAALHDYRFKPVMADEITGLELELSILSKPEAIKDIRSIQLGTHGIILKNNGKSAVYLPEVAVEQRWDLTTTLEQLSLKAGLTKDMWRDSKTIFETFTTFKIIEGKYV
jgi:AmmeMemoRadiSam system protein B/AmmeMemoRadiSam system protein A